MTFLASTLQHCAVALFLLLARITLIMYRQTWIKLWQSYYKTMQLHKPCEMGGRYITAKLLQHHVRQILSKLVLQVMSKDETCLFWDTVYTQTYIYSIHIQDQPRFPVNILITWKILRYSFSDLEVLPWDKVTLDFLHATSHDFNALHSSILVRCKTNGNYNCAQHKAEHTLSTDH